jgi:hypothetical protein
MEASPRVGPEQIALQRAPNARHVSSLVEVLGRINRLPELAKLPRLKIAKIAELSFFRNRWNEFPPNLVDLVF